MSTCMSDLFAPSTPPPSCHYNNNSSNNVYNNCSNEEQHDDDDECSLAALRANIDDTCIKLGIPSEPSQWSCEHSMSWLDEVTSVLGVRGSAASNIYAFNGRQLCAMSLDEFVRRVPTVGVTLHARLHLWITASQLSGARDTATPPSLVTSSTPHSTMNIVDWIQQYDTNIAQQQRQQQQLQQQNNMVNSTTSESHSPTSSSTHDSGIATDLEDAYQLELQQQQRLQQQQQQQQQQRCIIQYAAPTPQYTEQYEQQQQYPAHMCTTNITQRHYGVQQQQRGMEQLQHMTGGAVTGLSGHNTTAHAKGGKARLVTAMRPIVHTGSAHNIHLWQFLRELLDEHRVYLYHNVLRWIDRKTGTFKIENSHELARLWGVRKNRCKMNYDKLSRSLRQYYKKGILRKTGQRQRLIYQFCTPYNALLA